ncbi:MAG: hypothetical protein CVV45_00695 [Spirochaetae bacterium HGW-Spirochaetae-10]|nr:MAG: hypothetical protein CVV45_00695 [Spirochaetae bacterium HGW-Spirochaetae-10]
MRFFSATPPDPPAGVYCRLQSVQWNDYYQYHTLFKLFLHFDGGQIPIGRVKIADLNEGIDSTELPFEFEQLGDEFVSLGQGESYYEMLASALEDDAEAVLHALRDCAITPGLYGAYADRPIVSRSLFRDIAAERLDDFAMLARRTPNRRRYEFVVPMGEDHLEFRVTPDSLPPTNVHLLIGRNGVGKTRFLADLYRQLMVKPELRVSATPDAGVCHFSGVVYVAFSAFDRHLEQATSEESDSGSVGQDLWSNYVGILKLVDSHLIAKTKDELGEEFIQSLIVCSAGRRAERWKKAIQMLYSDPVFRDSSVKDLIDGAQWGVNTERALQSFSRLSSGHAVVLLIVTRLVELVNDRFLVLFDEPETHLHPPLLSALIRCVSSLLSERNAIAIAVSHSPVLLQEVPRECAWVMQRFGEIRKARRPVQETFGETVGLLTRDVFGLEVEQSGFYAIIDSLVADKQSIQDVEAALGGALGSEAQMLIHVLWHSKKGQNPFS